MFSDIIENSKDSDSRRAYQCIKLVVMLSARCSIARDLLTSTQARWQWAVEWLRGRMDDHSATMSATTGLSNEDSSTKNFQRTTSAQVGFKSLICYNRFLFLKFNQPSCIRELLSFSSHESTSGLRSTDGPYRLREPRAIGERGFANRSFSYIAPHLYNRLPITVKQIDSLNTFKSHLKAFLFSRTYDQPGLTIQEDYAL